MKIIAAQLPKKLASIPVFVDEEDYEILNTSKWFADTGRRNKTSYAIGQVCKTNQRMHRFVMKAPDGMEVDHINGNGMDNRKENLRLCTRSENQNRASLQKNNTTGFKGVEFIKKSNRWRASIQYNKKGLAIGNFKTKEEAARAYNVTAKYLFGEFAYQNKIE